MAKAQNQHNMNKMYEGKNCSNNTGVILKSLYLQNDNSKKNLV
jgi:hypothetical protein